MISAPTSGPGSGNTPSTSPAQGFAGGTVSPGGPCWTGAGGGGATAVGYIARFTGAGNEIEGSSDLRYWTTFSAGAAS